MEHRYVWPDADPGRAQLACHGGTIVCDTDAGTDVDDYLALAYLVNAAPDRLKLVSTAYGPVETRAKAVATLFRAMDVDIPVVVGRRELLTPGRPIWLTGREHYLVDEAICTSGDDLIDAYLQHQDFTLLAIGPLTNVAHLIKNPDFVQRCARMVIMGGTLHRQILGWEHNFHADPISTKIVLESDIPKVLIPIELTAPVPMTDEYFQLFGAGTSECAKLLWSWISSWRETTSWNVTYPDRVEVVPVTAPFLGNVHWHDPIAAAYITHPDMFKTETMRARIDDKGGLVLGAGNAIEVCTDMDVRQVIETIASAMCSDAQGTPGHPVAANLSSLPSRTAIVR
jgi:purine nucleosidase